MVLVPANYKLPNGLLVDVDPDGYTCISLRGKLKNGDFGSEQVIAPGITLFMNQAGDAVAIIIDLAARPAGWVLPI